MPVQLFHFDPEARRVASTALPLDGPDSACTVLVRSLPGADVAHFLLKADSGEPSLRAEVDADTADPVEVAISWESDNTLRVRSRRRVLLLPPDDRYGPPRSLQPTGEGRFDLLLLFDGTNRTLATESIPADSATGAHARPVLRWPAVIDRLLEFAGIVREHYQDLRLGCVAYGDHSLGDLAWAPDLDCRYVFYPPTFSQRCLQNNTQDQLREQIGRIEYTSGGDFVDALAEALERCQLVGWRLDARRMLLVIGDSPGHAVLAPAAEGADAHARRADVEIEALRLHEKHGVEIATLYLEPGPVTEYTRPFYQYTRDQFESLATIRPYRWTSSAFDPREAFQSVLDTASGPGLARKRSYALLDRVEPGN